MPLFVTEEWDAEWESLWLLMRLIVKAQEATSMPHYPFTTTGARHLLWSLTEKL